MSLVSQLEKGQIDAGTFVKLAAADLKKDLGFFSGTPLGATLLNWANSALSVVIGRFLSPTLAALIISGIETELGIVPATPAVASATPPAAVAPGT